MSSRSEWIVVSTLPPVSGQSPTMLAPDVLTQDQFNVKKSMKLQNALNMHLRGYNARLYQFSLCVKQDPQCTLSPQLDGELKQQL